MRTSEQIDKLAESLSKAQGEMQNPEKNKIAKIPTKSGSSYSYNYADLPEVINATKKALAQNQLCHSFAMEGNFITCRLMHSSGQWIESQYELNKQADPKLMAASITYARRYLLCAILGIAADEDTDSDPEPNATYVTRPIQKDPNEVKKVEIAELMRQAEVDGPFLVSLMQGNFEKYTVSQLTDDEYRKLKLMLLTHMSQKEKS